MWNDAPGGTINPVLNTGVPSPSRRDMLRMAGAGTIAGLAACGAPQTTPVPTAFRSGELPEISLGELRSGFSSGRWTSSSLCEACLDRIATIDASGPRLNSVIEINPDAMADARSLDEDRQAGRIRSPLHGIPVLLKDNIDTADRMQTSAGSLALVDSGVDRDSWVAARLRAAGALLIGKTNLSEWANFRSRRSTSGWSGRGGLTLNPYALDRNPCGSSSGSAVAVSAGLVPLSVGTETNGSIVCPASINGIVGIKPTVGLVGRSGIVPIAHTQDTAGPMARTVEDAAAMLGPLTGIDPRDPATKDSVRGARPDYTVFLDSEALQGARIGLLRKYWGRHAEMDAVLDSAVDAMRTAGAEFVDLEDLPDIESTGGPGFEVMLYEFNADLSAYLAGLGPQAKVRTLADVIRFNEDHRSEEMPYFGQDILESAAAKGPLTERAYADALARSRDVSRRSIDETLRAHSLDAFFAPTTGPAWLTDLVHGDRSTFPGCSSPAARAGYPHITVPGGFLWDLPVGVSFFGPAWSEARLVALAYAYEQATLNRRPPRMLETAALESAPPESS